MESLLRRSSRGLKLELVALTGTLVSSGTAVTGTTTAFDTELEEGDIIGLTANGWRRVVSITSATALVVDTAFDAVLAADTVNVYNYGIDPTLAAANIIEFLDDISIPRYAPEMQERNVVRNTFSPLAKVRGAEINAEGSINVELHGSGTPATPPETDPLWECAIGVKNLSVASLVATGTSATEIIVTASEGSNFSVGDAVLVGVNAGETEEVAWITGISTDTLTLSPALSATIFSSKPKANTISVVLGASETILLGKASILVT